MQIFTGYALINEQKQLVFSSTDRYAKDYCEIVQTQHPFCEQPDCRNTTLVYNPWSTPMPTYNDYPADIRSYDHDPRSPFYQDPYEILEDLTYQELKTLALETDDRAIDATLDERPDPHYAEHYTAFDLGEPYPHYEVWDDQFNPARLGLTHKSNIFPTRATYLHHAGLTPSPCIACHPYWTQAVAPTWTPARSAHITARILREYEDFLSNI